MQQRKLLITGTSTGIGHYMAEYFLSIGWQVFGCSRSLSNIEHESYSHMVVDLSKDFFVESLFKVLGEKTDYLDGVINNAGTGLNAAVEKMDLKEVKSMLDINIFATMAVSKYALPFLKKANDGRIINMGSVVTLLKTPNTAAYVASRAAVQAFSEVLAKELEGTRITCNVLAPGIVNTSRIQKMSKKYKNSILDNLKNPKANTMEEVARMAGWLLSASSCTTNGQTIYLNSPN